MAFIIKFECNAGCIGGKSVIYQSTKHRATLKLSHQLPNCVVSDHFLDFSQTLFY